MLNASIDGTKITLEFDLQTDPSSSASGRTIYAYVPAFKKLPFQVNGEDVEIGPLIVRSASVPVDESLRAAIESGNDAAIATALATAKSNFAEMSAYKSQPGYGEMNAG